MRFSSALIFGLLFFLAKASLIPPAVAAEEVIQVEVINPQLVSFDAGRSGVVGSELIMDMRFTNRSDRAVSIPDLGSGIDGITWIKIGGIQVRRPDGSWKVLFDDDLMVIPGDARFPACVPLLAGDKAAISNFKTSFPVGAAGLADLGSQSTVRLVLALVCRGEDGKVRATVVVTDPFVLSRSVGR